MFMKEVKERRVKEGSRVDADDSQRQIHALIATGASYYSAASSISHGDSNIQDCHYFDEMRVIVQKNLPRVIV